MPPDQHSTFVRTYGLPLLAVISAFLAIGVAMLIWMTYAQDRLQLEQERNLASAAIQSRVEFLHRNLGDYGVWNDAVENLVVKPDIHWANTNIGPYIYRVQGYEYSFVIGPGDRIVYSAFKDRQLPMKPEDILGRSFAGVLKAMRAVPAGRDHRIVDITTVDGRPALMGIAALTPSDHQVRLPKGQPASFILFVEEIDERVLRALDRGYSLKNLRFVPGPAEGGLPLRASSGKVIGTILWDSAMPGSKLRVIVLPFSFAFVICFILGVLAVLRQSHMALRNSQAVRDEIVAQQVQRETEKSKQEELARAIEAVRRENAQLLDASDQAHKKVAATRFAVMHDVADRIDGEVLAFVESLYQMVSELDVKSADLRYSAESTHSSAVDVHEATNSAKARLFDVVRATTELSRSCSSVQDHTQVTDRSLEEAIHKAGVVSERIDDVGNAIERIRDIATNIADITSQTNLLALNATIEAARAGESGRGFAVVAGEVKGLAAHIAGLTQEVTAQLAEVAEVKRRSILAIQDLIGSLSPASQASETIEAMVVQQSQSLGQVDREIDLLVDISSRVEAIAGAAGEAAKNGLENVEKVSRIAGDVSSHVNELLSKVASLTDELRMPDRSAAAG